MGRTMQITHLPNIHVPWSHWFWSEKKQRANEMGSKKSRRCKEERASGGGDWWWASIHVLLWPERSLNWEIRNRIGGDDVPTHGIPRSKERPLVQEERRWMYRSVMDLLKSSTWSEIKEGPSLFSRAQGGVLCAPKNKKRGTMKSEDREKQNLVPKFRE
jgi:hypothetical protein